MWSKGLITYGGDKVNTSNFYNFYEWFLRDCVCVLHWYWTFFRSSNKTSFSFFWNHIFHFLSMRNNFRRFFCSQVCFLHLHRTPVNIKLLDFKRFFCSINRIFGFVFPGKKMFSQFQKIMQFCFCASRIWKKIRIIL